MVRAVATPHPTVAHLLQNYLGATETFIYGTLTHHRRYRPVVACRSTEHRDRFPFAPVHSSGRRDLLWRRPWWWAADRAHYAAGRREWYVECMVRREGAVILHAHFGWEAASFLELRHRLGLPLVVSFYGSEFAEPSRRYAARWAEDGSWQTAYRRLFDAATIVVGEGQYAARRLRDAGCPSEKVRVVHIGVELQAYRQTDYAPEGPLHVVFCGRFVEKKGLDDALRAVAEAKRLAPSCRFHLRAIGDGVLRPAVEQLIRAEGLEQDVELLGMQPYARLVRELRAADVVLQPSRHAGNGDDEGGAPTVLIEAQAAGVPVISTRHCDIPEVVRDGDTGYLVEERDVGGMARGLVRMAESRALRERLGAAGRQHVARNFHIDAETAKLERIYDACIH